MTTTSTLTNLREVGGPGLQDARPRTVYRANTERVGADAYPHGLAAVVDLRRDDEVARVPHPLGTTDGYRLVPLFDPSTVESGAQAVQLEEQYIDWLERHRTGIAAAFRAIARSDGDVLVCCSAGKDRTGVVSGLLARLWGASIEAVGDDYAASAVGLADRFAAERAVSTAPEATAIAQRCVPETMTTVVRHVEARWGSVAAYLRWAGLTDAEIAAL
ncbi:tyrosine-protein phosphatase [Curtobacterium flaccumfaciens pv. oortii]|uniref:tyrosine-protein phosphatase n=1 Tax=Curtobacterium flaccumfaciens TaxID=2035 RepID=UPI001BDF5EF1|nr:tyrosine-protein phosphatase [Curtobacterium flaccumfaciens]MBT1622794.1 tyrosine-protein phosphatase [Curtobacterium flaccumfaciens pv. oortii]